MKIKLTFHNSLLKYTTGIKTHTIVCEDFESLVSAVCNLFPKFGEYIKKIQTDKISENICLLDKNKKIIKNEIYQYNKLRNNHEELYVSPVLGGAGGKKGSFLQIAIGVALIAAPFAFPGLASTSLFGTTLGKLAFSGGLNMLLSGVMGLFTKTPKPPEKQTPDAQERIDNNLFNGLQNTTSSNNNVPVIYGQVRSAGQLVSGYIKTTNHGKGEEVKVSEQFAS